MDDECTDHYEKQLYTVFKTFDVNNEEALDKLSVVQLCDALQLEGRGAALTAELFAGQPPRVSFAQFRAALLAALAAPDARAAPDAGPDSPDAGAGGDSAPDDASDEVSPRLVVGCKRYGRRSRPPRAMSAPRAPPAARSPPAPRSASAVPRAELDPARRLDADAALELCRRLRVRGVDRALVERVLRGAAAEPARATVGEFFDRLNAALTTTIEHVEAGEAPVASEAGAADDEADAVPAAAVLEAWERAAVPRPRRLLAELGFGGALVPAAELERALDDERRAAEGGGEGARVALLAALALARLRQERAAAAAGSARAERDMLRGSVAAGERRAALLAAEVDEQHARLEAELRAAGRRQDARRADDARAAAEQLAAERERAQAALQAAAARHADAERRLREEIRGLQERGEEAEAAAAAAEARAAELERALAAARSSPPPAPPAHSEAAARAAAAEAALEALRAQHAALRDRCDELAAALERRGAGGAGEGAAGGAGAASLWDEAAAALRHMHETDVSGSSMESVVVPPTGPTVTSPTPVVDSAPSSGPSPGPAPAATPASATKDLQAEVADLERQLLESLEREEQLSELVDRERQEHEQEVASLNENIERLEASAEALRAECERADRYWAEQLANGANRPGSPSGTTGPSGTSATTRTLCVVPETPQLEEQVTQLQRELDLCREEASAAAARAQAAAAEAAAAARALSGQRAAAARLSRDNLRLQRDLQAARARPPPHICRVPGDVTGQRPCMESCGAGAGLGGGVLAARLVRAGEAAARLATRLAHADRLVAELFAENCRLQAARVLPEL